MSTQLSLALFHPWAPPAHVRRSDPETSRAAAATAGSSAIRHMQIIHDVLKRTQPYGLTSESIADVCKLSYIQVVRRVSDLRDKNLIVATDERRRNRSGRLAVVWRAV